MGYLHKNAEQEQFAYAQRELFEYRDSAFAHAETRHKRNPEFMLQLTYSEADRKLWSAAGKIVRPIEIAWIALLIIGTIWLGISLLTVAGYMAIGIAVSRWLFPHLIRSDHDRYPSGTVLERSNASQSQVAALASLGGSVANWNTPSTVPWTSDTINDMVSLFVTIPVLLAAFLAARAVLQALL